MKRDPKSQLVWEQELRAGILLLSAQEQTLKLEPFITWLCDQSACSVFKDGDPAQDPRILRSWTYLQTLPVKTHHIPGVFNEFQDFLSQEDFAQQFGADILWKAEEVLKTLHVPSDLFMAERTLDWTAFAEQELRREREEVKQRGFTSTSEGKIGTWSQDEAGRLLCERLPVSGGYAI